MEAECVGCNGVICHQSKMEAECVVTMSSVAHQRWKPSVLLQWGHQLSIKDGSRVCLVFLVPAWVMQFLQISSASLMFEVYAVSRHDKVWEIIPVKTQLSLETFSPFTFCKCLEELELLSCHVCFRRKFDTWLADTIDSCTTLTIN